MSELFDDFVWRGLVHDVTDQELAERLGTESLTAYVGFDPTADSLQLGNLLGLVSLMRLQRAGHRPIVLAGGGTGLVGDPGGKSEERSLLSMDELEHNLKGIRLQLEGLLDFSPGPTQALLVDNGEWLWPLGLMEFLRDVGKHFTVNTMINKESVRSRLEEREQGISYTEFSYMLLQAYDFLHLFDTYGCELQMGGSDQWGNITMGVDLVRRLRGARAHALTWPLVTNAAGEKMGKSAGNAIWLDPARTSPYQLFQYLVRAEDAKVGSYVRAFTFLERERIEELDALTRDAPERREAQRVLAWEVTALVHGAAEADRATRAAAVLFTEEIASLDETTLLDVVAEAPSTDLGRTDLDGDGLSLVDALVATGLAPSKSAARTVISQGGAYVNNRREADPDRRLTTADALHGRYVVLRKGKQHQHLLRFS
ncbi:MAG TPA: tyrosine--tRNA ligase [Acidimicrobiales bacterium]|nr:tyrosine--tRNA ligase [Acidimicrobiales bacterium]